MSARLLLVLVLVAVAVSLLLVAPMVTSRPPDITNNPPPTSFSCAGLAGQIRWRLDDVERRALEREYDQRCPNDPPPTSLDR